MKIIHTADWHIGQTFFGYDRFQEHQYFLDWLREQISTLQVDALLISGDIFDVANPSAAAQRQFYRFLRQVTERNSGLQIIAIAGNHDSASRLETPIPLLEDRKVYIRGSVHKYANGQINTDELIIELKDRTGKRQAWCLAVPYLRQGDYPMTETEGDPYQAGVKALYDTLLQQVEQQKQPEEAIIAMGHLQAAGSQLSENDPSERMIIGGLEGLSANIFSPLITYGALGHIHREQRVSKREELRYAGSPLPMSFAEENYHHGVILLEIKDGKLQSQQKIIFEPLVSLLRIPRQPASLPEVLEKLARLPEAHDPLLAPYLEVRVLLTGPEPSLRSSIEETIRNKQVRLTRVVPFYPTATEEKDSQVIFTTEELGDPWKMLQLAYERKYHQPLPDELAALFQEAVEESHLRMGEKR